MLNINKELDPKLKPIARAKKKSGFTLIELIVVIAIIAILAAALTPSFAGYISEAKKVKVITQAKNVVTAYEADRAHPTSNIDKTTSVATYEQSSDFLSEKDINKLSTANIENCYKIVDTDEYTFKVDDNGVLDPASIAATTSPTETPASTTP